MYLMNATSRSRSDPTPDRPTAALENDVSPRGPNPRALFAIAAVAALLGLGITLSFGYADHDPRPHGVRVAVAAASAVQAKVAAGLQKAEPGGFDLVSVPSARAATQSVRSQTNAGAFIVPPSGAVTIVTAGATGVSQQQAITAALFAALAACASVFAMDTVLGALTGGGGALIGIAFLGALSFVLFIAALQAVVGLPGTALAVVAFAFVGNAISGGSVPVSFLPGGFRQIAPWLPNNAIVRGARDVVYFHGHDLGHPLLVLCLWPAVALSVLVAVDLIHLSERRRRPQETHEIYGTPAVVHVSRRLGTRRLQADDTPAMPSPRGGGPA
jgi:hypothetical protein